MQSTLIALLLLVLASPALASDGVLEINQTCAVQTGCFTGDTPGFPVTIAQAGSYRLTGNLTTPSNTTAIQVNSQSVTIELGGFLVSGPNVCTGYPTTNCTVSFGNPGISSAQALVVVRNGSIVGMGGSGISLTGPSSEVDRVRVLGSGGAGVTLGGAGRITRSFLGGNFAAGLYADGGVMAKDNEARANGAAGLQVQSGARLSSALIGNRSFDNIGAGIQLDNTEILVSRNVSSDNAGLAIVGGRSLGDNLCTGVLC
jgi:hypothetical protein